MKNHRNKIKTCYTAGAVIVGLQILGHIGLTPRIPLDLQLSALSALTVTLAVFISAKLARLEIITVTPVREAYFDGYRSAHEVIAAVAEQRDDATRVLRLPTAAHTLALTEAPRNAAGPRHHPRHSRPRIRR